MLEPMTANCTNRLMRERAISPQVRNKEGGQKQGEAEQIAGYIYKASNVGMLEDEVKYGEEDQQLIKSVILVILSIWFN
jgi:hypothetical protein